MQRRWLESRYHVRSAYEIFKVLPPKKKNAAPQQAKNFVGVKRRQNDRVCCRAVRSFRAIAHRKVVVITVSTTTFSAGFGIKGIMEAKVRQDSFAKFIAVNR